MLKSILLIAALSTTAGYACSGTFNFLRGEEIAPGVFNVYRGPGSSDPGAGTVGNDRLELIGTSTISAFKAHVTNLMASNELVFIGAIDSMVGNGLTNASAPSWLIPEIVLTRDYPGQTGIAFYARLRIDTLFKGNLPSKHFWFKGYGSGSSCDVSLWNYTVTRFLNFSNKFDNMTDLKLGGYNIFCGNCPQAHWFDGRYLRSPDFPVLRLDITEVMPTYPATGILRRGVPWRSPAASGKSYQPDGRLIPDAGTPRKTPLPALKKP
jgi:hypothetical protein